MAATRKSENPKTQRVWLRSGRAILIDSAAGPRFATITYGLTPRPVRRPNKRKGAGK